MNILTQRAWEKSAAIIRQLEVHDHQANFRDRDIDTAISRLSHEMSLSVRVSLAVQATIL
jgi:hypothetical protein